MMRRRYRVISTTALVFLALFIGATWLVYTESGLHFALQVASKFIPGKLELKEVHGSLAEEINVAKLSYQQPGVTVTAQHLRLKWQLLALLHGKLKVNQLSLRDIKITTANELLKPIKIDSIAGSLFCSSKHIDAVNLKVMAEQANFLFQGKLAKSYDFNWQLNINKIGDFVNGASGAIVDSGKIFGPAAKPQLSADAQIKHLQLAQFVGHEFNLTTNIKAKRDRHTTSLTAAVIPEGQVPIKIEFAFDNKQNLKGKLGWHTKNLDFVRLFFPNVNQIKGALDIDFNLAGSVSKPKVYGNASLQNASAYIPALNVTLKNVNL
ncbi:MAG: hypothetical protein KAT71_07590, partial [Gammaproteobacteria bacterium]|nr:hypothetical protein [Gammaproteobacteria bacterium]